MIFVPTRFVILIDQVVFRCEQTALAFHFLPIVVFSRFEWSHVATNAATPFECISRCRCYNINYSKCAIDIITLDIMIYFVCTWNFVGNVSCGIFLVNVLFILSTIEPNRCHSTSKFTTDHTLPLLVIGAFRFLLRARMFRCRNEIAVDRRW